jgi:hypothetical protein
MDMVTAEEWHCLRKSVDAPLTAIQRQAAESGRAKLERLLKSATENAWVQRTSLSQRCVKEASIAYDVRMKQVVYNNSAPVPVGATPKVQCCLCDRTGGQLFQAQFVRESRTTPGERVESDWYTIHPMYRPFLYALVLLNRARLYLHLEADHLKLYETMWSKQITVCDYIQCLIQHHLQPPAADAVREAMLLVTDQLG